MDKIKCKYCNKEYSKNGMYTHVWRMHGDGKDHEPNKNRVDKYVNCEYCKKEFNYRSIKKHQTPVLLTS